MKYVNQKEYPELIYITRTELDDEQKSEGLTTTISNSGCGISSSVMIVHRLIPNACFELQDAIELSYSCKANHTYGTDFKRLSVALAEKFSLELEMSNDPKRLEYCLQTGGAAVVHAKGNRDGYVGVFSVYGHYITAISCERDGRIAILDPSYVKGKYDVEGRRGKVEMKNDVIALCDIEVLEQDTLNADVRFYLFWRK